MAHTHHSQLDTFDLDSRNHNLETSKALPSLDPALPALAHAISGSTGAAISNLILYPLDVVISRLQVQRKVSNTDLFELRTSNKDIQDAFKDIYTSEAGLAGLSAGVLPDTVKSVLDSFIFFLLYSFLRSKRLGMDGRRRVLPALEELSIGALAGATAKFFTTPISNMVMRKRTASMLWSRSATEEERFVEPSIATIIDDINTEKGIQGFWSGYEASLILTINPSITFFFYQIFSKISLGTRHGEHSRSAKRTFFIAATSKALASAITYPVSLAKARAQANVSETAKMRQASEGRSNTKAKVDVLKEDERRPDTKAKRRTTFHALQQIYRNEGLQALYSGVLAEVLKGFMGHGTTMLVKSIVHRLVIQLCFVCLRMLKQYSLPGELATTSKDAISSASSTFQDGMEKARHKIETGAQVAREKSNASAEATTSILGLTGATITQTARNLMLQTRKAFSSVDDSLHLSTSGNGNSMNIELGAHALQKADEFVSKEAGHLLGNAQDMLGEKLSKREE